MLWVRYVIVVLALLSQTATAGLLDDFEEEAGNGKAPPEKKSYSKSDSATSAFGSGTYPSEPGGSSFLEGFWVWLVSSPFDYRHDDPSGRMVADGDVDTEGWAEDSRRLNLRHQTGSPVLPYLRADYNRQYIESNLEAEDVRIEAGYKLLAFHGRHTRYMETNPTDELTINQFYGVFRLGGSYPTEYGLGHGWEIGLGAGVAQQQGNEEHSSGALTLPIKFYPTEWIGVEFRPAWYRPQERTIGDYDLSLALGWRFAQLRGGYRWLWLQGKGHYFNGPYAGVSAGF